MTAFDQFLKYLQAQGLKYDTGFLIPEDLAEPSAIIGYRLSTPDQQIDLYLREEFWDASKSHPKFGESQEIAPGILVSTIIK